MVRLALSSIDFGSARLRADVYMPECDHVNLPEDGINCSAPTTYEYRQTLTGMAARLQPHQRLDLDLRC